MLTFKNHRGQFHKINTALVALISLYVIGAAVALSSPYWVSSTCMLTPLAAFAATPLGIGILAIIAIALISLAIYSISKNNEISELKAPKIVVKNDKVMLQVTKEVHEDIKANNQNKNEKGEVIKDEYRIDFSLEGKNYRIIVGDQPINTLGNTLSFNIDSLEVKNKEGKFEAAKEGQNETLGLNKNGAEEVNTYLGSLIVEQVTSQQQGK